MKKALRAIILCCIVILTGVAVATPVVADPPPGRGWKKDDFKGKKKNYGHDRRYDRHKRDRWDRSRRYDRGDRRHYDWGDRRHYDRDRGRYYDRYHRDRDRRDYDRREYRRWDHGRRQGFFLPPFPNRSDWRPNIWPYTADRYRSRHDADFYRYDDDYGRDFVRDLHERIIDGLGRSFLQDPGRGIFDSLFSR